MGDDIIDVSAEATLHAWQKAFSSKGRAKYPSEKVRDPPDQDSALDDHRSELEAVLIKNNETFGRWSCGDHEDSEFTTISEEADWFTLELRDQRGELHALSNPIFIGQQVGTWR